MMSRVPLLLCSLLLLITNVVRADDGDVSDADALKITALEALISAPPERALPRARMVLESDNSDEVKESALFILSQIQTPEAQALLLETAQRLSGDLQIEAIQMIGIGGDPQSLAALRSIYANGDSEVRDAVLESYLIADDRQAILELARSAETEEDLEAAIEMLGAMGARKELQALRESSGVTESLIEAYAISGDLDSLREIATDGSNPERQVQAIESLGIVHEDEANALLVEIYRDSDSPDVREAALDGLFTANDDEGLLQLYRASNDPTEKREILEYLAMMNSDAIWDVIDSALQNESQ